MGKKYKHLYSKIIEIDNIRKAYHKTMLGNNRYTTAHLRYKEHLETNLYLTQKRLKNQTYKIGEYKQFIVYEPKKRIIHSLPFRDRVVQHSIYSIINPIFEKTFYSCSYACRKDKGTHKGIKDIQSKIRKLSKDGEVFYLKMDFSKYFKSINVDILIREIRRKINDEKLINLLEAFMYKDGGIPIGNLLSQLFANIYGHIFDRFVKTKLKERYYFRYMDDTVILSNDMEHLKLIQKKIERFIGIFMKMKFSKWYIQPLSKPLDFLGYRVTQNYKLVRRNSVVRAKSKIKKFIEKNDIISLNKFLASWNGHIKVSNSYNLKKYIEMEMEKWKKLGSSQ